MGCTPSKNKGASAAGGGASRPGAGKKGGGKVSKNPSLHGNLVQDDNRKVDEAYDMGNELGKGDAGAQIVIAKSKKYTKTKRTSGGYAIKLYDGKSEIPPDLGKEAALLLDCDHPNIVKLFEMAKVNKRISLVMELCSGGSLLDRLPYKEEDASRILRQVLSAVAYLHHKRIVHRDVDPSNILFESKDPKADVKLIDFGCATRLEEHPERPGVFRALKEKTGSVHVMAPEVLKPPNRYSSKVDVWSVGVVAYMMLTEGKKPFDGSNAEEIEASIIKASPSYNDWTQSQFAKGFVKQCLDADPTSRPSAAEALRNEWIEQSRPHPVLPNDLVMSFELYGRSSPIKRVALNALARKASPEDVAKYRQLFRDLDVNQNGALTKEEFMEGFAKTGNSSEELEALFVKLDVNCNNEIMYTEFMAATLEASGKLDEAQLQEAFDLLDEDHSGVISKKNLLKMLGDSPAVKKSVAEMLADHDDLDFYDFQEMFQHGAQSHNIESIAEGDEDEEE